MFFTFSIGFQMYFCTQGEMIDLLAFFKFISSHILVIWNNKKPFFLLTPLFTYSNSSDNLLLNHLSGLWATKNGIKRLKTSSWDFDDETQMYQDSKQCSRGFILKLAQGQGHLLHPNVLFLKHPLNSRVVFLLSSSQVFYIVLSWRMDGPHSQRSGTGAIKEHSG